MGLSDVSKLLNDKKFKSEDWIEKNLPDLHFFVDSYTDLNISWKEKSFFVIKSLKSVPKCYCGKDLGFINYSKGYRKYCSVSCMSNSQEIKDKRIKTNIKRYGIDNPMKDSKIKEKYYTSIKSNYGVDNISHLESTKEKVRKTNLINFGAEYVSQTERVRDNLSKIMKDKSTTLNEIKNLNIKKDIVDKTIGYDIRFIDILDTSIYMFQCGDHEFEIHKNTLNDRIRNKNTICTICNPIDSGSDSERLLFEFIRSEYSGIVDRNIRGIISGEIDIYLPELNIGFEYNGIYWHSDKYKDSGYHLRKSNQSLEKGIRIIHIWEDDWINKREIVKSRIRNILGNSIRIWARSCEILQIDNKTCQDFLGNNHIQSGCVSKIRLGLYHKGDLVSVMTFGPLRKSLGSKNIVGKWELLRFCNKIGISVIGGASKLLSFFLKNNQCDSIISYADRSWSNGSLYRRLGFSFVGETGPNYYWVIGGIRRNRFSFRKDILVKEGFDPKMSETEIMKSRGYHRIFDVGSYKYQLFIS